MVKRVSDSKEETYYLVSDQDSNYSKSTATPSRDRKLDAFSLNTFDFTNLQASFERVVEVLLPPRLSGYLKEGRFSW